MLSQAIRAIPRHPTIAPPIFHVVGLSAEKASQEVNIIQIGMVPTKTATIPEGTVSSTMHTSPLAKIKKPPLKTLALRSALLRGASLKRRHRQHIRIAAIKDLTVLKVSGGIVSIPKRMAI
jgi:hypothetical protein